MDHAGVNLNDYSLGESNSWIKVSIPTYWSEIADNEILTDDLTGKKAYNWIKENVLDGAKFKRVQFTYKDNGRKIRGWRYDITKKNGESWSCEFTGYCADHDFVESLLDDIKGGCTLLESFLNLATCYEKLLNAEIEDQMSESYFIDHAESNNYQFTEDGLMI